MIVNVLVAILCSIDLLFQPFFIWCIPTPPFIQSHMFNVFFGTYMQTRYIYKVYTVVLKLAFMHSDS